MKLLTYDEPKVKQVTFEPKEGKLASGFVEAKWKCNSTYLSDRVFPYMMFDGKFVRDATKEEINKYEDLLLNYGYDSWRFTDEFLN